MADFVFENHFSLWMVQPTTAEARQHLQDHVGDEAQWLSGALAVEPRYVTQLAESLEADGFSVEL